MQLYKDKQNCELNRPTVLGTPLSAPLIRVGGGSLLFAGDALPLQAVRVRALIDNRNAHKIIIVGRCFIPRRWPTRSGTKHTVTHAVFDIRVNNVEIRTLPAVCVCVYVCAADDGRNLFTGRRGD